MTLVDAPGDYAALYSQTGGNGFQGFGTPSSAFLRQGSTGTWSGGSADELGFDTLQKVLTDGRTKLSDSTVAPDLSTPTVFGGSYFKFT